MLYIFEKLFYDVHFGILEEERKKLCIIWSLNFDDSNVAGAWPIAHSLS